MTNILKNIKTGSYLSKLLTLNS